MSFFKKILNLFKFQKETITTDEAIMLKPVDEIEEPKTSPKKKKTITRKPKKTEE